MSTRKKQYTAAERKAWGQRMAAARAAKLAGYGAYKQRASQRRAEQMPRSGYMSGTGDYKSTLLRGAIASKNSGGAFAPDYGRRLGADIGEGVQGLLKAIGFGDYQVEHNSLMDGMVANSSPPSIVNTRGRTHIVRHREFIQDIYTSSTAGAFNLQSFLIQPGLNSSFPWLSILAAAFEEYRVRGIIYEFKSMSGDATNSTAINLGSVILATEYDSSRPNFINKQQMENHEFASSGKPSCNIMHPVECKASLSPLRELWVRTGAVPTGDDPRLYDFGNFQIATVGFQGSNINIGELWVTYEVEFLKPQLISGLGLELLSDKYQLVNPAVTTAYFGTSRVQVTGSNLGTTVTGTKIAFPPGMSEGTYLILWAVGPLATAGSTASPTVTLANCTQLQVWDNDTSTFQAVGSSSSIQLFEQSFIVSITGQNATITFSGGTLPTGTGYGDLIITQINGNIVT